MKIVHAYFLAALGVHVVVACTNTVDRGGSSSSSATDSGTGTAPSLCAKFPDHRLNWEHEGDAGSDLSKKILAPAERCAERLRCLDSARLDSAVTAKARACLELDTDKDKRPACSSNDVVNASVTRAAVTAFQNTLDKKIKECILPDYDLLDITTVLSDATIEDAVRCLDKPCSVYKSCLKTFRAEVECIEDLFDPDR